MCTHLRTTHAQLFSQFFNPLQESFHLFFFNLLILLSVRNLRQPKAIFYVFFKNSYRRLFFYSKQLNALKIFLRYTIYHPHFTYPLCLKALSAFSIILFWNINLSLSKFSGFRLSDDFFYVSAMSILSYCGKTSISSLNVIGKEGISVEVLMLWSYLDWEFAQLISVIPLDCLRSDSFQLYYMGQLASYHGPIYILVYFTELAIRL